MARPIYEQGAPLMTLARFHELRRQGLTTRIAAGEAAIEAVPAYKRSWCKAETEQLRAALPKFAETLSEGEISEHVAETLEAAFLRNRRRPG